MKSWILVLLLFTLLSCLGSAKRGSISNGLFQDDVKDDLPAQEEEEENQVEVKEKTRMNPCHKKKCYRGEMCRVDDKEKAECVCIDDCTRHRTDSERRKVCSNKNDTYLSECDLDRDHCLCKHEREGCSRSGARKIQLEYYGVCKAMPECLDHQMAQFPKRMRDWLFIVMEVLERRAVLKDYQALVDEAREDGNHTSAVIWKFCDLDKDPQDRFVSRRELQYTVRTLRALEHCLVPFLDDCDADDNREITLPEWAECLGVEHEHISNRCVEIHEQGKKQKKEK